MGRPLHFFCWGKADFLKTLFKENKIFWNRIIFWNGAFVWFGCKPNNSGLLTACLTQSQLQPVPRWSFSKCASNKHILLGALYPQVDFVNHQELESQLSFNFCIFYVTLNLTLNLSFIFLYGLFSSTELFPFTEIYAARSFRLKHFVCIVHLCCFWLG